MDDILPEAELTEKAFPQDPAQRNLPNIFSRFYPEKLPGRYCIYGIYPIVIPNLYEFVAAIVPFEKRWQINHRRNQCQV